MTRPCRILLVALLLTACGGDPAAVSVSGDDATPPAEQADDATEIPSDSDGEAPAATDPEPTQSEAGEDGGQAGEPEPPAAEGPADQPPASPPPADEEPEPPPDDDDPDEPRALRWHDGGPASDPPDGLVVSMTLDRTVVRSGERLEARRVIENRSDRPIEATHRSGCRYGSGLYQGGEYRGGQLDYGCTDGIEHTTWEPGEVDERTVVFEAIDGVGDPLPPGTYLAVWGVNAYDEWWIALPIEIEIVE